MERTTTRAWDPYDSAGWAETREWMTAGERPWPEAAICHDLRWWAAQVRTGRVSRIPTSRTLAEEWHVGRGVARRIMRAESIWTDPKFTQPKTDPRSTQAQPKLNPTASGTTPDIATPQPKANPEATQPQPTTDHTRVNTQPQITTTSTTASAAEPASDLNLGKGLTAGKVNPSAVAVFTDWQQRQKQPRSAKLTKARHSLLISALGDYSTEELRHVVAFAYDAPIGAGGIPDGFARAWRGDDGQKRPGLEMLFRRSNVARNIEMAAEWSPTSTAQGHRAAPAVDRLATPGHWWERMSQEGSGGIRRVRMEAEAKHGVAWWDIMRRVLNDAGVDGSWFNERQYKPRDERDQRRAAFVESFNRRHA